MRKWLRMSASALLVLCMLFTMVPMVAFAAEDTTVAIADADVLKLGRYYEKDGNLMFDWSNSGISFNFKGTGAKAVMTCSQMEPNPVYVNVYVDDAVVPNASFQLTKVGATEYVLAEGLADGEHTITIRKRNEANYGGSATLGINSLTILGGDLTAAPTMPERRIEVIGDSITAGFGNLVINTNDGYNSHVSDGTQTYATLTAAALGAEIDVIARSGIRFVRAQNDSHYTTYEMVSGLGNKCTDPYDFAGNEKDAVIINLGTNDNGAKDENGNSVTDAYITSETVEFLKLIRKNNPNAEIVWAYGIMGSARADAIKAGIEQYKTETEDTKVSFYALANIDKPLEGYGVGSHPTRITAINRSFGLADYIAEKLGWDIGNYQAQLGVQLEVAKAYDEAYLKPYTAASAKALTDAIDAAKALDATASNADVKAAIEAIQQANLNLTIDTTEAGVLSTEEKSATGHYMQVTYPTDLDLTAYVGHKMYLTYEAKLDCTLDPAPTGTAWMAGVRNGRAYLTDGEGNETEIVQGLSFGSSPANTAYGNWVTLTIEIPESVMENGVLKSFRMFYYNDTATAISSDAKEGLEFSNDGGVTLNVRNVKVLATVAEFANKDSLKAELDDRMSNAALTEYSPESAEAYNNAFDAAQIVYDNPDATQKEINDAVKALRDAIAGLELNTDNVLILQADELVSSENHYMSVNKDVPGGSFDLTPYAGMDLMFTYEMKIDATENHPDPDYVGWINKIVNGQMRVFSGTDFSNEAAIPVGGNGNGQISCGQGELTGIKPGEWFTVTLPLPEKVMSDGAITRFHIYMYNDLDGLGEGWSRDTGAIMSIRNVKIIKKAGEEIPAGDKTALNAAIAAAEKITDLSGYTDTSAKTFTDALAAAKAVAAKDVASQVEIDNAKSALETAQAALTAKPAVDKAALNTAIADAKKLDLTDYTEDSAKALTDAIAAAEAVVAKADATQTEVDAAKKAIEDAQAGLTKKPTAKPGDVNGNGEVTAEDALMALQIATNKVAPNDTQKTAADVDGNGDVTANDALLILQFATKKIAAFPQVSQAD